MELGTWADWIAGLATVASVFYAVTLFGRSALAADRAQADNIVLDYYLNPLMPLHTPQGFKWNAVISITNRSSQPMYDVIAWAEDERGGMLKQLWKLFREDARKSKAEPPKPGTIWDPALKRRLNRAIFDDYFITNDGNTRKSHSEFTLGVGEEAEIYFYTDEKDGRDVFVTFVDARNQMWTAKNGRLHPKRGKRTKNPRVREDKNPITIDDLFGKPE